MGDAMLYDDGNIACDDDGVLIRWYYLWGPKRVRYSSIKWVREWPLGVVRGKWRLWGSGDLTHWYNLDTGRPRKSTALVLDVEGNRLRPAITPKDPAAVQRILEEHGVKVDDSPPP
ncbi:MAG TPA: hypothetical protein VHA73_10860 [Acidimicrobiales bacterium]|jgi:hypothetical protein|nr:hypothetical protein [Acidimicrobiales bacterium]